MTKTARKKMPILASKKREFLLFDIAILNQKYSNSLPIGWNMEYFSRIFQKYSWNNWLHIRFCWIFRFWNILEYIPGIKGQKYSKIFQGYSMQNGAKKTC